MVEELHRKLGMAKQDVDLAQAKKEELWEKCVLPPCPAFPRARMHRLAPWARAHTLLVVQGGRSPLWICFVEHLLIQFILFALILFIFNGGVLFRWTIPATSNMGCCTVVPLPQCGHAFVNQRAASVC